MLALIMIIINLTTFAYAWVLTRRQLQNETVYARRLSDHPNMNAFEKRLPLIYFNIFTTCIAAGLAFWLFDFIFLTSNVSVWAVLAQLLFIMAMDDLWFYIAHRTMHQVPWIFKHIHAIHHRVRSPLPLDYLYVHPLEWMAGTVGIIFAVLMIYVITGEMSAYSILLYAFFRPLHEIHLHSGLPSLIMQRLKHMGSSEHHTMHHSKIKGNYASTFKWLDRTFDTHMLSDDG